jgi:hypothetical protein
MGRRLGSPQLLPHISKIALAIAALGAHLPSSTVVPELVQSEAKDLPTASC